MATPCKHCAKPRGGHAIDCPNYFTGDTLLGVPGPPAPPPDDADEPDD